METFFPVKMLTTTYLYFILGTYEASTTSRPQGEIDIDPTGCSTRKEVSSPNVGLSKAEVNGMVWLLRLMVAVDSQLQRHLTRSKRPIGKCCQCSGVKSSQDCDAWVSRQQIHVPVPYNNSGRADWSA